MPAFWAFVERPGLGGREGRRDGPDSRFESARARRESVPRSDAPRNESLVFLTKIQALPLAIKTDLPPSPLPADWPVV